MEGSQAAALLWKGQCKCITGNMDNQERCHPMDILHASRDMVPLKISQSLNIPTKVLREKSRFCRGVPQTIFLVGSENKQILFPSMLAILIGVSGDLMWGVRGVRLFPESHNHQVT